MATLAIVAASSSTSRSEIRHLQRTEVREAEEPFGGEQRGSSAMPHKRNPVRRADLRAGARGPREFLAALENIALWHERDISHSSVERVILPDSTILVDYMLHRTTEIVANMKVFPERMLRNLDATQGLVFSGQLLQDLVEHGAPREDAYKWVQAHAMAAWESEIELSRTASPPMRIFASFSTRRLSRTLSICGASCAPSMRSSGAFLAADPRLRRTRPRKLWVPPARAAPGIHASLLRRMFR